MNHFARRVFVTAHVFATAFRIVLALEFGTGIAAADPDADYAAMLARVKSSTDGIDFRALRGHLRGEYALRPLWRRRARTGRGDGPCIQRQGLR